MNALIICCSSLGHGLDGSIEALLAYIFEKVSIGSNRHNILIPNAGLDKFNLETLMDIALFYYWFPKSAITSARFYADNMSLDGLKGSLHQSVFKYFIIPFD